MTNQDLPKECILERIEAMMLQEQTSYRYESYFPAHMTEEEVEQQHQLHICWREKICQWSYNVVDHFDLPREVVAVSLNLFDRYLATRSNLCTGNMALLVSLTTLHIAIKIHSEKSIKLSTLASLSRGQFGAKDIEEMEWKIFKALDWKLHPPTLFSFISHLLMIFPSDVHHSVRKELFEVAIYMAELSVCDSSYVRYPASIVAIAAILNVMEDLSYSRLSRNARQSFWEDLTYSMGVRETSRLLSARTRLRSLFTNTVKSMKPGLNDHNVTSSPTSTTEPMQVDETVSITSTSTGSMKDVGYSYSKTDRYRYSPSPTLRSSSPLVRSSIGTSPLRCSGSNNSFISSSPIAIP